LGGFGVGEAPKEGKKNNTEVDTRLLGWGLIPQIRGKRGGARKRRGQNKKMLKTTRKPVFALVVKEMDSPPERN